MLIPSFLSYFKGYLIITVTGTFPERFINVCTVKNILLWDIVRISDKAIRCKISVRAFRLLPQIVRNTGVRVKINARHGFPFFLQKYRKRKLLLSGVFILITVMIVANQFVWDIEVRGNHTVKTSDILAALENEGLKCGVPKAKIDQRLIKNNVILKLPSLAWLWIDKRGSKIIVDVRERMPVPQIFDPNEYCNITAAKDAVIESMIVRNGIPVVSEGDTVLAGTVLVTGKITSPLKPDIRYVHSEAQIYARVWYEKTETFSRLSTRRIETGNKKRHMTLSLFGKDLPLFHNASAPFANSNTEEKKHELSLFGNYLGITLKTTEYTEVSLSEERHTVESIAAQGAKVLKEQIDDETMPDSKLISVSDSYAEVDDTTVSVTVRAEYLENISVKTSGTHEGELD